MIKKIQRKVTVYLCTCERCGYEWESMLTEPKRCASCRNPNWNIPKEKK
jgi:predicted Zn-ribbon and HTH transcriptional regulator